MDLALFFFFLVQAFCCCFVQALKDGVAAVKKGRQETGNTNLYRRLRRAGQNLRRVWQPGIKIIEHPDMTTGAVILQLRVSQGK